jgi:hypothetical protein
VTFTPPLADAVPALDLTVGPPAGPSRRVRWLSAAGAVGVCTAGLAYIWTFNPNVASSPYPQCLFKAATGLDCPGCGGTRAVYSLLHGDWAGAADHYALIYLVAPLMVYFLARFVLDQFGVRLPAPQASRWMGYAAVGVLLAFTVVRNLPFGPFHYLGSGLA